MLKGYLLKNINITSRSQLIESFLYLGGKPYGYDLVPSWRPVINTEAKETLYIASRQVGKSQNIASIIGSDVLLKEFHSKTNYKEGLIKSYRDFRRILFVSPSDTQSKLFSSDRLNPMLKDDPEDELKRLGYKNYFKEYLLDTKLVDKVSEKKFLNDISVFIRSSYLTADRIRGISADRVFYEEMQDLIPENMDVIDKVLARSEYKYRIYAGTPKSTLNPIQKKWELSTQVEWFAECTRCGKNDIYIDARIISKEGPRCPNCKNIFNPSKGRWIMTGSKDAIIKGYRVTQFQFLNCPWVEWSEIWKSFTNSSKGLFLNEDLGLSYDGSSAAISLLTIKQNCANYKFPMEKIDLNDITEGSILLKNYQLYVGIDWGSEDGPSSTVVTVGAWFENKFHIIFLRRIDDNVLSELKRIKEFLTLIGFSMMICDAGYGHYQNMDLKEHFGFDKTFAMQHSDFGSSSSKNIINWNQKIQGGGWVTDRTKIMTAVMKSIERGHIQLPDYNSFMEFQEDLISIRSEHNERTGKLKYIHSKPDDAFHSILYCYSAALMHTGQPFPVL
jgi:hypothetical protein